MSLSLPPSIRTLIPLVIGLLVGGVGATMFLQSMPGASGSAEERANKLELELRRAQNRLAELEGKVKAAEDSAQVKEKFELALAAWTAGLTPDSKLPDGKPLEEKLIATLRIEPGKRDEPRKKELETGLRSAFEKKVWPELSKKDAGIKAMEDAKAEVARYRANDVPRVMVMRIRCSVALPAALMVRRVSSSSFSRLQGRVMKTARADRLSRSK